MTKHLSQKEIIDRHIESDKIIEEAIMNGDYKRNNREVKKLNRLKAHLKNDPELALHVYSELFKSDCVTTQSHAAVESLRIGIHIEKAISILEELSKREDIGIIRLGCETALKLWRGEIPGKTL